MQFRVQVNRTTHTLEAEPDTPLLWVLRELIGLTGTKYGCGIGSCGACMVHIDGVALQSCQVRIADVGTGAVITIEGLSSDAQHPVQVAWREHAVPQCGFCQSGQIMSAAALLATNPAPAAADIASAMNSNICRCGTYPRIRAAIEEASRLMRAADTSGTTQ